MRKRKLIPMYDAEHDIYILIDPHEKPTNENRKCNICGVEHGGMDLGPGMNCYDYAENADDVAYIKKRMNAHHNDTERED